MEFGLADNLMRAGVAENVFPGAVLLVADGDHILFQRAYGWADLFAGRKMTVDTCFDLASLTKPLATALAVMYLVQYHGLDLDRVCASYCPEVGGTNKASLTVRQLLSHQAGLIAWRPYYMRLRRLDPEERLRRLRCWLLCEPLQYSPGTDSEYSDVGFLLLQWIMEVFTGETLAPFVTRSIFTVLGITDLYFPSSDLERNHRLVAATEFCPWRNRLLIGEVHDDNAAVLGGAAAHAGLFGSAKGVCELLQGLLVADTGQRPHTLFDKALIRTFFQRQGSSEWALGFDTPSQKGSSAGSQFSRHSVGHLGYTGTSFWMDRRRGLMVVLLSNRVHPSRYNAKIQQFRPHLHNAVITGLRRV